MDSSLQSGIIAHEATHSWGFNPCFNGFFSSMLACPGIEDLEIVSILVNHRNKINRKGIFSK